jgi:hypothetical protein
MSSHDGRNLERYQNALRYACVDENMLPIENKLAAIGH